ncbi:MAG: prepilin-type N-terminal cleavage/methylation domain-containing protein [Candidatus Brocadiales bacterium]|nr:prepilin-type N-terminal cleavage/methylation domain-containing protein [Candidatus Bathyanammoxibius amoris]
MKLLRRAKKLFSGLKDRKGFTLPEVAAVVAITATLAAVVVPVAIDQIESARVAKAKQDVDGISAAISLFHKDTGTWPTRTGETSPTGVEVLRSGSVDANFNLFATTGLGGNVQDPDAGDAGATWGGSTTEVQALVNHLTIDNPGGTTATPNGFYIAADVNWAGPYMAQVFNDPWGRNYLIYANAFTNRTTGTGVGLVFNYVWIISGGPNETLETGVNSPILNNEPAPSSLGLSSTSDDIGIMMFQKRASISGVSD